MIITKSIVLSLLMACCGVDVFSLCRHDKEIQSCIILQHFEVCGKIIHQSPNAIKCYENDRLYLDESRMDKAEWSDHDLYLTLDNNERIYISSALADEYGVYLSTSYMEVARKLFILVCNNCMYRWEGGVFTTRCPRCRSKDFSIEINR